MSDPTDARIPPGWVPVERRFLGMDRPTLLPAGIVAALVALAVWVLPAIDSSLSLDDPARAGDVVQVGEDATFFPAADWNIDTGLRAGTSSSGVYPRRVAVSRGGVTFEVETGSFEGDPGQLLEQIRRSNDRLGPHAVAIDAGRPTTIANDQGTEGALARFATASAVGLIAAFVFDGTGVEVVAYGPPEVDDAAIAADVAAMLRSVRPLEGDR